ncbi:DUF4123 domain-containing protein [Pseudomonas citronellolis]|uniref:DUF4123 domain-containing protein n=1 Tax=Pseudomonas citronellolis TaxID=53408 RepID=UPI002FD9E1DA
MSPLEHWLREQSRMHRQLYLVLDADGNTEALQALLNSPPAAPHISLYASTEAAPLAARGPFVMQLANRATPALATLLAHPERHWGWLASAEGDALAALARHWRARMLVGQSPQRTLYRFHDNRVLARALAHLPEEGLPAYLGPAASLCYWSEEARQWLARDNPMPGEHPLPETPAWLAAPQDETTASAMLHHNLRFYLLAWHTSACARLAQRCDFDAWLTEQLRQAREWRWTTPEQLRFWLLERLENDDMPIPEAWQPRPGETPSAHYERLGYAMSAQSKQLPPSYPDTAE